MRPGVECAVVIGAREILYPRGRRCGEWSAEAGFDCGSVKLKRGRVLVGVGTHLLVGDCRS